MKKTFRVSITPVDRVMMQQRSYSSPFCLLIALVAVFICSGDISLAQTTPQNPPSNPSRPPRPVDPMSAEKSSSSDDGPPLTTFEEEMRAKRAIRSAEKDHQQNLERARELSQLAKDLQQGFKSTKTLDREGLKRLERLEKLTKKIRGESGGEKDEVQIINRPSDKAAAIDQIVEASESLSKGVQSTPRRVISAGVIDGANVLLELIAILRSFIQYPQ